MYQGKFHPNGTQQQKAARKITPGTIVFYTLFFLFIAAFILGLIWGLGALEDWLVRYESSQSTHKSQEVFDQLFANPDWAALYETTGQEDTAYEGVEAYTKYMQQLVGDSKLTMAQTSAGMDANKEKYLVKLNKTVLADFTLVNSDSEAQIPHWELDELNIYYERRHSVQVALIPGNTVYINDVALDESHIISSTTTLAEEYLPEGLHGYRQQIVKLTGLLTEPTVTIKNPEGDVQEVTYDEATGMYTQVMPAQEPSQEILDRAIGAGQTFIRYMLADVGRGGMQAYFDVNGNAYQTLPSTWELWVQDNRGFTFGEPKISEFYQYSDTLYSIRVNITTTVTRLDYTQKDYNMDTTFLFHVASDGRWLVDSKTNEELQTQFTHVRLAFHNATEEPITMFVDSTSDKLTLPPVVAQEGKEFLGWFTKEVDENGKTTMHLAFSPSEDGTVYLPSDTQLPPMELYAQFK